MYDYFYHYSKYWSEFICPHAGKGIFIYAFQGMFQYGKCILLTTAIAVPGLHSISGVDIDNDAIWRKNK